MYDHEEHAGHGVPDEDDRVERFTKEEEAFLRFVRFGELPARVLPADMVELVETGTPGEPPPLFDPSLWGGAGPAS
ncbi:hypothetical protein HNP84_009372 [Thermocatellispora tengchongensis]|uniref:Uncharacterized protein n=1 Tax=Thermocatellispora tengchongensis TaxID=1073253 RepID=A0A840PJA4_9ACTN|nr:hypothetical protein [Thermocatellispora tengchongensis]MBB5139608.1 hypothetical protein [Thermocatellispora tengchongensis]